MSVVVKYKLIDGSEVMVAVTEEVAAALAELDRREKSNERRETRRHKSLDGMLEKRFGARDYRQDIDFMLEWKEKYREEVYAEKLQRKVFAKFLNDKQAEIFYQYKILKYSKTKIGKSLGITEGAIRKHILKAEPIIEKILNIAMRDLGATTRFIHASENIYESIPLLQVMLTIEKQE